MGSWTSIIFNYQASYPTTGLKFCHNVGMTHLSRRVGQILVVATLGCVSAFAEELRSETLRAWVAYVELTEQRIAEELESKEGFLVMDFLPPADASRAREVMLSGDVFVLKMETRNEEGRRIGVPDGMIHHWYGSIFVPGAALEDVIAWVQNYARHSDYFDEVVESPTPVPRRRRLQRFPQTEAEKSHYRAVQHRAPRRLRRPWTDAGFQQE